MPYIKINEPDFLKHLIGAEKMRTLTRRSVIIVVIGFIATLFLAFNKLYLMAVALLLPLFLIGFQGLQARTYRRKHLSTKLPPEVVTSICSQLSAFPESQCMIEEKLSRDGFITVYEMNHFLQYVATEQ